MLTVHVQKRGQMGKVSMSMTEPHTTVNLEQMKLAVCLKLSELFYLSRDGGAERPCWRETDRFVMWSREGLQVCHEASVLMNLPFRIERALSSWSVTIWLGQTDERKVVVENKDLLTAWLEALCRVWWPERFDARPSQLNTSVLVVAVRSAK